MKRFLFLFIILCGLSGTNYAQLGPTSCCGISPNSITTISPGNFSATSAQAYYWEICAGSATITGSNTNQTVSVNCTGNYTLKVTRFVNGNCVESCKAVSCGSNGNCPTSNNIGYSNEGAGGLCTTGLAYLSGVSNVSHVNWTWALGSHSGSVNNAGTTTPIYYPSGNWNNYYIVICAQVVFNDGSVCNNVCRSFLLDCGSGLGDPIRTSAIYPNPTEDRFQIKNDSDKELIEVVITNSMGVPVKTLKKNLDREVDLSAQDEGVYYLQLKYADESTETKILSIER